MIHRKVTGDKQSSTKLVTDGKTYLLNYNVVEKVDEDGNTFYEYDQVMLTKNEYEYQMSIKEFDNSHISNLLKAIEE